MFHYVYGLQRKTTTRLIETLKILFQLSHIMGKGDQCAVFGCNNDRRFPEKYIVKEHTSLLGEKPQVVVRFCTCKDPKKYNVWTKLPSRKDF